MGEEEGARGSGSAHWFINTIDGTSNFAAGIPFFCVSIGVALGDQMLAGVIFDPIRQELFFASTQGAFLNGKPIQARGATTDAEALLVTAFPNPQLEVSDDDARLFGEMVRRFTTVRRMGCAALALASGACGRADVIFEPAIKPWDVDAGMRLVQQAGGRYVSFGEAAPHKNLQPWMLPACIATCPEFNLEQSIMSGWYQLFQKG